MDEAQAVISFAFHFKKVQKTIDFSALCQYRFILLFQQSVFSIFLAFDLNIAIACHDCLEVPFFHLGDFRRSQMASSISGLMEWACPHF